MPKRTNEFQHLIVLIELLLTNTKAEVTESKELMDNILGKPREVDVVIEYNDGVHKHVTSVECTGTSTSRAATVTWVEQMIGKHTSLPTNKLVLVSQSGFTSSAQRKADHLHIDAMTIQQAEEFDWEPVITNIDQVGVESFLLPYLTKIRLIFRGDPPEDLDISSLDLMNSTLYDSEGNAVDKPCGLVKKWISDPAFIDRLNEIAFDDADTVLSFKRILHEGCYLIDGESNTRPIIAIEVEARCRKEISKVPMKQGSFGDAQISHGTGSSFGHSIQVVMAQKQDDDAKIAISFKKS